MIVLQVFQWMLFFVVFAILITCDRRDVRRMNQLLQQKLVEKGRDKREKE
jgi:hypothetical protein